MPFNTLHSLVCCDACPYSPHPSHDFMPCHMPCVKMSYYILTDIFCTELSNVDSTVWSQKKAFQGGKHTKDQRHKTGILIFCRYAKKSMFKIVYHGGFTDPWAGLMAVPEAKQVKRKWDRNKSLQFRDWRLKSCPVFWTFCLCLIILTPTNEWTNVFQKRKVINWGKKQSF